MKSSDIKIYLFKTIFLDFLRFSNKGDIRSELQSLSRYWPQRSSDRTSASWSTLFKIQNWTQIETNVAKLFQPDLCNPCKIPFFPDLLLLNGHRNYIYIRPIHYINTHPRAVIELKSWRDLNLSGHRVVGINARRFYPITLSFQRKART